MKVLAAVLQYDIGDVFDVLERFDCDEVNPWMDVCFDEHQALQLCFGKNRPDLVLIVAGLGAMPGVCRIITALEAIQIPYRTVITPSIAEKDEELATATETVLDSMRRKAAHEKAN